MRRWLMTVPVVVSVMTTFAPTAAVAAVGDDQIVGRVLDGATGSGATASGVAGICVAATVPFASRPTASTTTTTDGVFRLAVPDGTYKVSFRDCRPEPVFIPQWWEHASSAAEATPVTVGGLKTKVVTMTERLLRGAEVTGTVTDRTTSTPISGICVTATSTSFEKHAPTFTATTAATGAYHLDLPNDTYTVGFNDCRSNPVYLDQWWDHAADYRDLTLLTVDGSASHSYPGVDAALDRGGTITGHITDDATGQPIPGVCLTLDGSFPPRDIRTDVMGGYTIPDVRSGSYQLMVSQCTGLTSSGARYAPEFYDHQPNFTSADPVTVQAPATAVIDETMFVGGSITGHVTDAATGLPVSGITVSADADDTASAAGTVTDANGDYTISGLFASARYVVAFLDQQQGRYATQWWDGQSSQGAATLVAVAFDTTTSGVDAAMQPR